MSLPHPVVQAKLRIPPLADASAQSYDRPAETHGGRVQLGVKASDVPAADLVHPAEPAMPLVVSRKPDAPQDRTHYAFDTGRATAAHLQDPDVVRRFNELDDPRLEAYQAQSQDSAVIEFITDILAARERAKRAVVERVVQDYAKAKRAGTDQPGGACFAVARERVETATREVTGNPLTEGLEAEQIADFDRLWGVHIRPKEAWLRLPEEFRGKGSAGAIAFAGKGHLVDQAGIWAGHLEPGAVIQTWKKAADFQRVKQGELPKSYGHSFIFVRYVRRRNGTIIGMRIADQGFQSETTLKPSAYGFWTAANILISGPRPYVEPRLSEPDF